MNLPTREAVTWAATHEGLAFTAATAWSTSVKLLAFAGSASVALHNTRDVPSPA